MDPAVLDRMLQGIPRLADENLLIGFAHSDDCAVYRLPSGELLVQTVDFFTPVVDDPYDYGAIAAANSLSDIYAMNGRPLFALNVCCFPKSQPPELWREVLRGGAEKAGEAGIPIAGGHTVDDAEPKYGLVVTGIVSSGRYWENAGALVGDALILTKPLGTGIITTALKGERIGLDQAAAAISLMKELNRTAARVLSSFEVHACTDITGFGLLGHAWEMASASEVGMEFSYSQIPFLQAALALAADGRYPGGTHANRLFLADRVVDSTGVPEEQLLLLFDAQTSGGLFAALPVEQAESAVSLLREAGVPYASVIGRVTEGTRLTIVN